MDVLLYKNVSQNNVINKQLTLVDTKSCIIKDNMLGKRPTILLKYDDNLEDVNYAFIPEFNRYYFAEPLTLLTGGKCEINLTCDVLETFKDDILNSEATIEKSTNIGTDYFNDGSFNSYCSQFVNTYAFPEGFNDNGEFILITAGG